MTITLNIQFLVDSIVRIDANSVEVYPHPGASVPFGLGFQSTGRYISDVPMGDLIYNRTNTYLDAKGRLYSIGSIVMNLCHNKYKVVLSASFVVRTIDPTIPFSQDKIQATITSLEADGKLAKGYIRIKPLDGGKIWQTCVKIR